MTGSPATPAGAGLVVLASPGRRPSRVSSRIISWIISISCSGVQQLCGASVAGAVWRVGAEEAIRRSVRTILCDDVDLPILENLFSLC